MKRYIKSSNTALSSRDANMIPESCRKYYKIDTSITSSKHIKCAEATKKSSNPYKDINHVFEEGEFDDNKFFYAVQSILDENNIPADDLKGNVYSIEDTLNSEIDVKATLSWIFYPEDISKKEFASVAKKIEKIFSNIYGQAFWFECNVVRYDNSEYTSRGYDVEMDLRTQFALDVKGGDY